MSARPFGDPGDLEAGRALGRGAGERRHDAWRTPCALLAYPAELA